MDQVLEDTNRRKKIMGTIRDRVGKIHMYTHGVSFGIPEYLAEKGLDVNIEYVGDGIENSVLAIEIFKTKKLEKEEEHDRFR